MMHRSLSILGLLLAAGQVFAQESWVGKIVVIKTPGVTISPMDPNVPVVNTPLDEIAYRVMAERDGQLGVKTPRSEKNRQLRQSRLCLESKEGLR